MAGRGEAKVLLPGVCQRIVPSAPGAPKFSVELAATFRDDAFLLSVVPCAAAMVELPENERPFVRVSFAVVSSSSPVKETVPVPNAPAVPIAGVPAEMVAPPV